MTVTQLKEEITSIVEGRGVKTIQKDYSQVLSDIEKALDFYKKNKDTDKKDAFVKVLKKLGEKKKQLAQELDDKVSGMYKNAEYQGESVTEAKPAKTNVSKKDWRKIKSYNKHIGQDGTHYVMKYDDKLGTYLQAVNVTNEASVNEATEPEIISQLRDVVKNGYKTLKDPKTGKKMKVDSYSASAITQVYDAIKNPSTKDKFVKSGLLGMQSVSFKAIRK